jgi:hypothetical protein
MKLEDNQYDRYRHFSDKSEIKMNMESQAKY